MFIPPIFLTAFSYEKNIQRWEKVGAVPLTMTCLENECVFREVDYSNDDHGDLKLEQLQIKMKWQADHLL